VNSIPVILRELTVASRRRETWNLRLLFAFGLGLAFVFGLFLERAGSNQRGLVTLWCQATTGFVFCLGAGPYLTADAISSEKREGTLGLLLLTPLDGLQIVVGKIVTHSLQVTYALLGVFPFLFLPILLGGVVWDEVLRVVMVLLLTLWVSLATGILWSTLGEEARSTAMGSAASLVLLCFLPWFVPFVRMLVTRRALIPAGLPQLSPITFLGSAFDAQYQTTSGVGLGTTSGAGLYWTSSVIQLALGIILVFVAGRLLPRVWRRGALSRHAESAAVTHLGTPDSPDPNGQRGGRSAGRPSRSRTFAATIQDRPLVWLASRNLGEGFSFRVLCWIILGFFLSMLGVAVATRFWQEGFLAACASAFGLHILTRLQAAWTATQWLNQERRSGALELILTTPVDSAEVLAAHHLSLRGAFRRPMFRLLAVNGALQAAVLLFWDHLHMNNDAGLVFSILFTGGALVTLSDFVTLRWLGLREALRQPTPARAMGRTLGALYLVAWVTLAGAIALQSNRGSASQVAFTFAIWLGICLLWNQVLIRRCQQALKPGLRPHDSPIYSERSLAWQRDPACSGKAPRTEP
jgi:ABC-type transport system involved in multi-copper enzyme maturation permease subunit